MKHDKLSIAAELQLELVDCINSFAEERDLDTDPKILDIITISLGMTMSIYMGSARIDDQSLSDLLDHWSDNVKNHVSDIRTAITAPSEDAQH